MLTIEIISVGKLKEKYLKDAVLEYSKRLSRFCNFKITELNDYPDDLNEPIKEEPFILQKLKGVSVPLCIEGKQISSEELAEFINNQAVTGNSHITFIIGGTRGLSDNVKKTADLKLSFSKMTFPHQLMRLILTEQIYRAFKIINNENYHK